MELSTRYNIGDKVWLWHNNKKVCAIINKVVAAAIEKKNKIVVNTSYRLDICVWREERFLFKTKDEL